MSRTQLLFLNVFIIATCGLVYELVAGALAQPDLPDETRIELDGLVVTPEEPDGQDAADGEIEPVVISSPSSHELQVMEAVPKQLDHEVLVIEVDQQLRRMALAQIQALSVGGIQREGQSSYLIVDLLLDAPWGDRETLRVVRLLSNSFDPRTIVPASSPLESFQKLIDTVLKVSEAVPLPDPESARGRPFRSFPSLEHYETEVLNVAQKPE